MKKPLVHPMIEKSAKLLDQVLETKDWDRLINIQSFNIHSAWACVLGQTGQQRMHAGEIPDDGTVPWHGYSDGANYIDQWADEHPEAIRKLGLESEGVTSAFACEVPEFKGMGQNEQWEVYLKWRRSSRRVAEVPGIGDDEEEI